MNYEENAKSGLIYLLLFVISTTLLIGSLFLNSLDTLLPNFFNLQLHGQRLYTDAMLIGSRNGAMLNAAFLGMICLGALLLARVKPTGYTISLVLLTIGFGFAGITCIAVVPIIFGTWVYAKIKKRRFKDFAHQSILAFALSPVVNEFVFGETQAFNLNIEILFAIVFGILVGMVVPSLASQIGKNKGEFKMQYELLSVGIVAFVFYSAYKTVIIDRTLIPSDIGLNNYISVGSPYYFWILLTALFLVFIVVGFLMSNKSFKAYLNMINEKNDEDDYVSTSSFPSILINIGVVGLITLAYFAIFGAKFHGITVCAFFVAVSMACLKLNPLYIPFIWVGLMLSAWTTTTALNTPVMLMGYSFSLGMVSLSKKYGIFYGILAGIIFNYINIYSEPLTMGFNLYNAGAMAGLTIVVIKLLYGAVNEKPAPQQAKDDNKKYVETKNTISFK